MALTQKQELFCREVVSGKSYKDAYITAYNTSGKDTTIRTESAKLALREDIQERIKALSKPLQVASQIEGLNKKEERIKYIQDRIKLCEERQDESSILRYVDMLNKIDNLYKEVEDNKENDNSLTNLDTSILAKIVKTG
jgi:hypothetical protein